MELVDWCCDSFVGELDRMESVLGGGGEIIINNDYTLIILIFQYDESVNKR